jgi:hypothetical protein
MHMTLANFVLFLHIGVAIFTFGVAGVLLVSMSQMRKAESVAVLRSWVRVAHRIEPMFPILVLVLIVLGGWLIHLSGGDFRWSNGWVITSVVALVLMEAYGGIVLAPAGKKLHQTVEAAADGPVSPEVRAVVMDRAVWAGSYGNMATALGILFLMPTKPSGPWSIAIVGIVGLAGVVTGLHLAGGLAAGRAVTAPAPEVAG